MEFKPSRTIFAWMWIVCAWCVSVPAHAVLQIEITQGIEGAAPIAIVPFEWNVPNVSVVEKLDQVISDDLRLSGYFSPISQRDFLSWPTQGSQVRCQDWRMLGAENVVIGRVTPIGQIFEVTYELHDVLRCKRLDGLTYRVKGNELRRLGHQIADAVFKNLTGIRGAFATRIAYVVAKSSGKEKSYELQVADWDGHNASTILTSRHSIISPTWSPDGTRLAYASFEHLPKTPVTIYIQDLAGKRERLLESEGQVSAPAWSPDGTEMAVVIARNGQRDIYIVNVATKATRRLTRSLGSSFTTEPVWSPDGRTIVYTDDLGGRPQLYRVDVRGGRPQRVTFEGNYNTRGTFSPDGKLLGMVHGDGAGYHIAVLEFATGAFRVLSKTSLDESPTFAPNGSMILFATRDRNRGVLTAVSADGRMRQSFSLAEGGDVREPAWGPFLTQ